MDPIPHFIRNLEIKVLFFIIHFTAGCLAAAADHVRSAGGVPVCRTGYWLVFFKVDGYRPQSFTILYVLEKSPSDVLTLSRYVDLCSDCNSIFI